MPVHSKIAAPYTDSPERDGLPPFHADSGHAWSYSASPDHNGLSAVLEPKPEPSISRSSGLTSAYNHKSRAAGAVSYGYGSRTSGSAHAPDRNRSHVSASQKSQRSHSYISISSDNDESIELLELRAENNRLTRENLRLEGGVSRLTDAYNTMVQDLSETVKEAKHDIEKMVHQVATTYTGRIAGVDPCGIPLNPKKSDYRLVNNWGPGTWREVRKQSNISPSDDTSPILSRFFEDEFGAGISDIVKKEVRGDVYGYWADMLTAGQKPLPFTQLGMDRREDFRKKLEGKYNWLRLCDGHWKVYQLWINYYTTWKNKHMRSAAGSDDPEDPAGSATDNAKEQTPIEVSSDEDNASAGSKRRREDDDHDSSSKKRKGKGKGKEVPAGNFHHARPQPKKKANMKVAKDKDDPFAEIRITPTVSETPPAQSTPVASGSGFVHPAPPPPSVSEVAETVPETSDAACNTPAAAHSTRLGSVPTDLSLSPTPTFSPVRPNPRPPQITPVVVILGGAGEGNAQNPESSRSGSVTASSDSTEPVTKKARSGPVPYKQIICAEWMKENNGTASQFNTYWKNLDEATKNEMKADVISKVKQHGNPKK